MTHLISATEARSFLRQEGESAKAIKAIVDGFDMSKPVYIQPLYSGETLYQYMRKFGYLGNWFALKGATMEELAIFGGGSGRVLKKVEITHPVSVLEGVARQMEDDWTWGGGGIGGATQLYMPSRYLLRCTRIIGPVRYS